MPKKQIVQEEQTENKELNKYQKKTDREHILDNPDTYIGSVELIQSNEYILNSETSSIEKKSIEYNPGLYKLFDEGIVNCRDHVVRMQQQIDEEKQKQYFNVGWRKLVIEKVLQTKLPILILLLLI